MFSSFWGWPAIVIGGQLLLQTIAWGFFGAVQSRGGIALPPHLAASAKANPHTVEWLSTQMSTILAFSSTLLFSWGVRRSVTLRLRTDGMPLATFVSFVKISSRSFIFDFKKPTFTFTAIVIIILTGVQTAGWSALITPRAIVINTPLIGHEIDLSSPLLRQMPNNAAVTDCIVNGTSRAPFIVGQTDSGYAAVKGDLSLPATFNVMDQAFNRSTGGILPLTLSPLNSSTWFPGTKTLPPTIKPVWDLPHSLTSSYSLSQQGFTADVSCEFWNSTDPTIPIIHLQNDTVGSWQHPEVGAANVSFATLYSDCATEVPRFHNWTGAYTLTTQRNYILMIACPSQDNLSYKLVFDAGRTGLYGFMGTTVCSLSPKITNVSVTYSDVIDTATRSNSVAADISGPAIFSAVTTLYDMVYFSQAIVSNSMGDKLRSLIEEVDGGTFTHNTTLRTTEKFIRGVTEYSGSVFRACLSTNTDFLDALPSSMNVSTSGMFRSETVGWVPVAAVTILELLPGTIVALLTICTVVMAVLRHAGEPEGGHFDPSDVMHLVAAAAAGGLNSVFVGTEEERIRAAEDVHVSLGTTTGRGAALVVNRGSI
ncbi:hypothetical protein DFH08DRAFT_962964 [Mycena albidolilacea]|uniref:Uncharacterized protein n=1 Tax=Mycena albidolilacea TaxID=1033008 RepID=A0AAD6ZWG4_9AGAR|nr:hypothetical protein DFH08DRAFT_962964 [Mycena albidolilacea]